MSEFAVRGAKIKPLIKLARSAPVPFAFNPDATGGDHMLCMHRRKSPALLGKSAKKEGPSQKVAFGEFEVDGKLMSLMCEKALPKLAKNMKSYLRGEGITLNIRVLDEDGNVIEEDVEDLPEDNEDEDAEVAASPEVDEDAPDPKELVARLQAVSARLKTAPAPVAAKLTPAVGAAAGQIKTQEFAAAEARILQIERVLEKLDAQPQQPDPAQAKILAAIDATEAGLDKVVPTAQAAIGQALQRLHDIAEAGELAKAAEGLKSLRARMADMAAPPPEPGPAQSQAQAQAQAEEPEPGEEQQPMRKISIVAFQRSRIVWLDAKRKMKSSLEELRDAIIAQSAGDEDQDDIKSAAQSLVTRIEDFDEELEDVLMEITTTPDGPERNKHRLHAAKVIGKYSALLGSPFYKNLDDNPFVKLDAVATAQQTLALVGKAVA